MNCDPSPVFGNWPQIVLLGDSITQFSFGFNGFWGASVADHLQRKVDVINRGFSGYNTRNCRSILPLLYNSSTISRVFTFVICLGANDASDPVINPTQGLLPDEYVHNLCAMVNYLDTIGLDKSKVIFITPPPLDQRAWEEHCKLNKVINSKSSQLTAQFAKTCVHTAHQLNVEVIDMHTHMMQQQNWKTFLIDGLHLTHRGGVFWAQHLIPTLMKRTKDLPLIGPYWQLFNPEDPLSSTVVSKI